jgi:hypothetical protein
MVEGSRLVRRVRWNWKVSGQEWEEASTVSLPELRSRSYHERLGGLRSTGWFPGFAASGRRTGISDRLLEMLDLGEGIVLDLVYV